LAATKYWQRQNIGSNKILAATKHWRQQNIGIDKMFASTKWWHQQNIPIHKMLLSTKYLQWQNIGARQDFTIFCQTTAVNISTHIILPKIGENKKWSPSLSNISSHTHDLQIEAATEIQCWGLWMFKRGVGDREAWGGGSLPHLLLLPW
jgi:hypothetical protein